MLIILCYIITYISFIHYYRFNYSIHEHSTFVKLTFTSNKNQHNVFLIFKTNTDNSLLDRALIFIVHGVGEHSGRYDRLAAELHSKLDAYIFSHDHHGHGYTHVVFNRHVMYYIHVI